MQRQKFRHFIGATAIELFERMADLTVAGAAIAFQQAAVGGFLGQRVAKT